MKIRLAASARADLHRLEDYYASRGRESAVGRLTEAVDDASRAIAAGVRPTYPAPRPYPALAAYGARWIHAGRYWFSFRPEPMGYVITAVLFETANIPSRVNPKDI